MMRFFFSCRLHLEFLSWVRGAATSNLIWTFLRAPCCVLTWKAGLERLLTRHPHMAGVVLFMFMCMFLLMFLCVHVCVLSGLAACRHADGALPLSFQDLRGS